MNSHVPIPKNVLLSVDLIYYNLTKNYNAYKYVTMVFLKIFTLYDGRPTIRLSFYLKDMDKY